MRVGLVRHFPVELQWPSGWPTSGELDEWKRQYDASRIVHTEVDLGGTRWSTCLSSDLDRAVATAKALFVGSIETTALLREAEFFLFETGQLRLPVLVWRWLLHLSWITGHRSQRRYRDEFRRRVLAAADEIEKRAGDVLVVSHAGMMLYLGAELRRRGFVGPKLRIPKHATLYAYDNFQE
jgi:broad specificity phosphatase PhoE